VAGLTVLHWAQQKSKSMNTFTSNKIQQNNEIIANDLKERRQERKLRIEDIAKKLKINVKYLLALENGQLKKLPDGLYGKKILNEYALFLNLDADFLTKLWSMETENQNIQSSQNIFSHKVPHIAYFIAIPKIIKNALILFCVIICTTYLGYYLKNIVQAPMLRIDYPTDNLSISQNYIYVAGSTEPETNLLINNEPVLTDTAGKFSQKINLSNDLNTILIVAKKKYSKESIITRRVLVKPEENSTIQ